jgi:prepilin-type N-terminal cleavage/methylation domain-containing protein
MKTIGHRGFTIIELMVALVVGGLLMAGLVALSGALQRSFTGSQDTTELQANLRFAMARITDDLQRAAFMHFADPDNLGGTPCHLLGQSPAGWSPTGNWRAIEYLPGPPMRLILRGNYASSRDYYFEFVTADQGKILCHDQTSYTAPALGTSCCQEVATGNMSDPFDYKNTCCGVGAYQRTFETKFDCEYNLPFGDGGDFNFIFLQGQVIRLEAEPGMFTYHQVVGGNAANLIFQFSPPVDPSVVLGQGKRVSPIITVEYQMTNGGARGWILQRIRRFPMGSGLTDQVTEIADLLLPPPDGLAIEVLYDRSVNRKLCGLPWTPNLPADSSDPEFFVPIDTVVNNNPQHLLFARAFRVTLRGRTPAEDPRFFMNPLDVNYAVDLDTNPNNGLAHVRIHRSIVYLTNMALNLTM